MTDGERQAALERIADEVRVCTRCRLHQQRNRSVPGEGNPDTEVVFVGEGPGFNEDRDGRPFVGRAGGLLVKLLASVGWRREDVFITNVVKCRPPDNRDPEADEIAACAPYLQRQLEALDPALVVTLGRFSMGTFMPGARISAAHGTLRPVDPATGASDALAFAMYHPAAALRSTEVEQTSFRDMAGVPLALLQSREGRERRAAERRAAADLELSETPRPPAAEMAPNAAVTVLGSSDTEMAPTPAAETALSAAATNPGPTPAAETTPSASSAQTAPTAAGEDAPVESVMDPASEAAETVLAVPTASDADPAPIADAAAPTAVNGPPVAAPPVAVEPSAISLQAAPAVVSPAAAGSAASPTPTTAILPAIAAPNTAPTTGLATLATPATPAAILAVPPDSEATTSTDQMTLF